MAYDAELSVDGLRSDQVRSMVQQKLMALDGVNSVAFDQEKNTVTVNYDAGKVTLVTIKQEIMEEGIAVVEI